MSVARSTPTLPTQAQRSVGKGTPKKLKFNLPCKIVLTYLA
ncbi:MAG: hypothetical protein NZ519_08410 [Bacteroidia bacterium]|nr:hypothetical protein [Bacteroidia bacterium]